MLKPEISRTIDILSARERHQVMEEWNATEAEYPSDRCIHELFEQRVGKDPDAVAVVCGEVSLSYAELNRRANRLAHYLRELGVGPDSRVAICVDRGWEMIVGLLGVLKSGGAYVPLDPGYPVERLRFMLEDSGPVALLTQGDLAGRFSESAAGLPVLDLHARELPWRRHPEADLDAAELGVNSRHLAYIIYTSGSTGRPKGVMIEHRGLCNLVVAQQRELGIQPADRVLQFASFSFDACVWEVLMGLMQGASLHLPRPGTILAGEGLVRLVADSGITHATLPPAVLAGLPEQADLGPLRVLLTAGDVLSGGQAERWRRGRVLINAYGPTETTICATMYRCQAAGANVPIGRPIANTRIYVLNPDRGPVPVGVAGEIYIGGAGVARGYLNRPELTAERFVPDPFVSDPEARMYRSGDRGRWLADGNIEFLGRNDFQVKVRGFRIELGEIEFRLAQYPGVGNAVVIAREDRPGDKRLVAYYTGTAEGAPVGAEPLRAHLSDSLPGHMVPAAFVRLESMPLTRNGKIDRKALPAPEGNAYAVGSYEPPQGETELQLARIWADVLGRERVGRHDNFFQLGGHSLLAVQLVTRIRARMGMELLLRSVFEAATLEQMALKLTNNAERPDALPPRNFPVILPLRTAGSGSSIFCVHAGTGIGSLYTNLHKTLHDQYSVYAIQARGLDPHEPPAANIEEMAEDYVHEILKVRSKGPYILLGWSIGGVIAHTVAARLQERIGQVRLLVLLDSVVPSHTQYRATEAQIASAIRGTVLRPAPDQSGRQLVFAALNELTAGGEQSPDRFHVSNVIPIKRMTEIFRLQCGFAQNHTAPIFRGDALFFEALQHPPKEVSTYTGWPDLVIGQFYRVPVACRHMEMMHPGPSLKIGELLNDFLGTAI